ncbi:hypothetical protein AJ80_01702 [Polytolypa hystricis UAMH7299]|uniref:1,3-beta-glucanosyltransferase n=1 Tax=Polytolypa hystricis (strain UAMH7299) TaxID=1447883 RepID=A0A2B7Z025_POLH7|nr:hypothetical protein AJ80_01702 [Polytolypa hystricis UAMH7299]
MKLSTVLVNAALIAGSVAELDPIVIKGSKFFYKSNGTEFFMRGIAYQQDVAQGGGSISGDKKYKDPLADVALCKRDVPLLQELRTNTIRVYAIDPEADHTECMKMLDDAGIYVIADLSEPATSIIRSDPKWNDDLYERYTSVVDELAKYTNTIGFFAGNEVSNNKTNTDASAFVKAAVRDTKAYIKSKNYREMGVGYATNDDAEIRDEMTNYFNCGSREETIDFWGYNIYSWCGNSNFKESGYEKVVKDFSTFSVPVFFGEYGCNDVQPRKFTEVGTIYGKQMTHVLSGGIVYMYFQEENDYGLVEVKGGKLKKLDDFDYLKKEMAKVDPTGVKMDDYKPSNTELAACPTNTKVWQASETLPPTPNKELCSCMVKSLSCVASSSITDKRLGDLFGTVCGLGDNVCAGISADASKGVYGAYSMCNPKEQLSFALNTYYLQQEKKGNGAQACDFDGAAKTQTPTEVEGNCKSLMDEAGTDGTGQVTTGPEGSSDDSSESSSAAYPSTIPSFNFGLIQLGAYLVCGVFAGAGMILL